MNARQAANVERWAQQDAALAAARTWAEAKVAELAAEDAANLGPCLLCPTLRRQWSDLCDDCNDAFHDLAQLVQDNRTPALRPCVLHGECDGRDDVDQVPGQLELGEEEEYELDVDAVLEAVRSGNMGRVNTMDLGSILQLPTLTLTERDLVKGELWRRS